MFLRTIYLALALLVASPAGAETHVLRDFVRDPWRATCDYSDLVGIQRRQNSLKQRVSLSLKEKSVGFESGLASLHTASLSAMGYQKEHQFRQFWRSVQANLVQVVRLKEKSGGLSADQSRVMQASIEATQLVSAAEYYRRRIRGGISASQSRDRIAFQCGSDGLNGNAVYDREQAEIFICPGLILASTAKYRKLLDREFDLAMSLFHEIGHSIDSSIMSNTGVGRDMPAIERMRRDRVMDALGDAGSENSSKVEPAPVFRKSYQRLARCVRSDGGLSLGWMGAETQFWKFMEEIVADTWAVEGLVFRMRSLKVPSSRARV